MSDSDYKQTEIGKVPKEWEIKKLGDYINLVKGVSYRSEDYCPENEGYIFINLKCVARNGGFREEGIKYYKGDIKEEQFVKPGDIVIANTDLTQNQEVIGSPMKIPYLKDNRKMCISLDLSKLEIVNAKLSSDFLYYYLMSPNARYFMVSNSNGTTVLHLLTDNVADMLMPVPPLPEQKAIASVLGSLDDKIDLLHKENQTLEQLAETLFHQWFIEEADDSWEESTIGDIIEILSGFPFKSDTFNESGKYNIITIKAVQDGYLELSNADKINIVPNNMPSYCYLEQGDILLSLTGNVGRCCFVDINNNLLLNQRVAKLKPKNNRDIAYTYIFFRMQNTKQLLEEMAKGTAQPNLSPIELLQMKILIPPTNKLETFAETSNPLIQKLLDNKIHIRTLENLRDTLLPKLMSGEVRLEI